MKQLPFNEKPNTAYAIPLDRRDQQILSNCKRVKDRVEGVVETLRTDAIAVVGYGPSLKKTWEQIKDFKYVMTCSGAHPFLIERGIIPTWHLAVDPLPKNTVELMGEPHPDVEYLMASTVYPDVITHLQGYNVKLWHIFASDEEGKRILPRGEWSFTGGADAGLRCLVMARALGFTDIHVFGLDGSTPYKKDCRHAGKHPTQGKNKELFYTEFNGKKYMTTPGMLTAAQGVLNELDQLSDCTFKFYGSGLIQDMVKNHKKQTSHGSLIAFEKPELISKEMREMNRQLHLTNPTYGAGGGKHAETVRVMASHPDVKTVLDYGCGRGYLQKALGFPVYEYDPAIEGKDQDAIPADLVVCSDVLEHVEPDKLKFVLDDLQRVTKQVGFFVIHLGQAVKTYANGQNAHLLVQPADWWTKQLKKFFKIETAQVKGKELHVVVSPKVEIEEPKGEVEFNGQTARFYTPNETTEWRVNTLLKKEPVTVEWLSKMKEGDVFYDIGANMGGYSVLGAFKGAQVFAFEPEAQNYALLVRNLELNGLKNASAYSIAVSDRAKLDTLHLSARTLGGSCHSFGEDKDAFGVKRNGFHPTQGCFGMTLDAIAETLPQPDHIKIDVDGFEPKVIEGGRETLRKVRSLLVEVNPALPEHLEMIEELKELGFTYSPKQVEGSTRKSGPFKGVAEYIFYRESGTQKHLLRSIEAAQVIEEPFPHFVVENVLPDAQYNALMASLPTKYAPIKKVRNLRGYPQRFVGDLERPEWIDALHEPLLEKFGIIGNFTDEHLLITVSGV